VENNILLTEGTGTERKMMKLTHKQTCEPNPYFS